MNSFYTNNDIHSAYKERARSSKKEEGDLNMVDNKDEQKPEIEDKMKLKEQGMNEDNERPADEADEAKSTDETECETCGKKGEECTCKKKGAESGEDPAQAGSSGADANSSISPGASTPSQPQNTFSPQSQVSTGRESGSAGMAGQTPSDVHYGKSVNLTKSPLYVELNKQLSVMQKELNKRVEAMEKSVAARISNLQKSMDKVEKFYQQPFYKAAKDNTAVEQATKPQLAETIQKQARFVQ